MSTTKSILIVEDEALVAEDLKEILISLGYSVAGIADNSMAAIALAREKKPDLITMDIHLAGQDDGISTMEEIRKKSDVPVIYVTAFTTDPILERAKKTKPSGYIIKPFNERQIHSAFEIAFYNHDLDRKVLQRDLMISALINATTNPLLLIDSAGIIQAANDAMVVRAAGTHEELQGMNVLELFKTGIITEQFAQSVKQALEGNEVRFEETYRGSWYDNLFIPVFDDSGNVVQAAIFCNDISFCKQAEGQVRTFNEQLIAERTILTKTQEELRNVNNQLEGKVRERTIELEYANTILGEQNRLFKILNAGTRALLHVQDEAGFIPQVCEDLLITGGYSHVWLAGLDPDGAVQYAASAGIEYPEFSGMLASGKVPPCADLKLETNEPRAYVALEPFCMDCPLSPLHKDRHYFISTMNTGEKPVALLGITLQPDVTLTDHETICIGQIAQEIAFAITYLRTKEREQKAYRQISKNLEQLAILNDHIRNPLQGIIGYAGMGEGEKFDKIIKFSREIDSIVTKLDQGYLESKKIRDFMERHEHIILSETDRKFEDKKKTVTRSPSNPPG